MEYTKKEQEYLKKKGQKKTAGTEERPANIQGMPKQEAAIKKLKKMGYDAELDGSVIMLYVDRFPAEKERDEFFEKIKKDVASTGYDCSWGVKPKSGKVKKVKEKDKSEEFNDD